MAIVMIDSRERGADNVEQFRGNPYPLVVFHYVCESLAMLLPTLFLLPVMVVKCLFLLSQPLGMAVMELFQTFVIKPRFDWCQSTLVTYCRPLSTMSTMWQNKSPQNSPR